jgi:hypothetical protein
LKYKITYIDWQTKDSSKTTIDFESKYEDNEKEELLLRKEINERLRTLCKNYSIYEIIKK